MSATIGTAAAPAHADNAHYVKLAVTGDFPGVLRDLTSERTAVYRVYAENGDLLYIGMSSLLVNRFRVHRAKSHWWAHAADVHLHFMPRHDAWTAEEMAIYRERPLWNYDHNVNYFAPDLVAARARYGPMPERFVNPGRHPRCDLDALAEPVERQAS